MVVIWTETSIGSEQGLVPMGVFFCLEPIARISHQAAAHTAEEYSSSTSLSCFAWGLQPTGRAGRTLVIDAGYGFRKQGLMEPEREGDQ